MEIVATLWVVGRGAWRAPSSGPFANLLLPAFKYYNCVRLNWTIGTFYNKGFSYGSRIIDLIQFIYYDLELDFGKNWNVWGLYVEIT